MSVPDSLQEKHFREMFGYARTILFFFLSAIGAASAFASESNLFVVHDHFSRIWSQITKNSDEKRVELWKQYYRSNNSLMLDIQEASKVKDLADKVFIAKIESRAAELPKILKNSQRTIKQLRAVLTSSLRKLHTLVPIAKPIDVYLVLHPHPFNGKEFLLGEQPSFALNLSYPDFGNAVDLSILVAHEAFHVLHLRETGRSLLDTAEGTVLREGLAVYATKRLFPDVSEQRLLFFTVEEYKRCSSESKELGLKLLESISRGFEETNKLFFSSKPGDSSYPPRCGYYLGYKMMDRLISNHSIADLMKMPYEKFAPLVRGSLHP